MSLYQVKVWDSAAWEWRLEGCQDGPYLFEDKYQALAWVAEMTDEPSLMVLRGETAPMFVKIEELSPAEKETA